MKRLNNLSSLNFLLSNPIKFNLFVFFITFILLFLFAPFTLNHLSLAFLLLFSIYYSTIPFLIYFITDFLFGTYIEQLQNNNKITIKIELIFYLFILFVGSLLIFIYSYILSLIWPTFVVVPITFILRAFQYSFTIGSVIIASIKLLDYLFYFKFNYELQISKDEEILTIVSNTKNIKQYKFYVKDIVVITSEKNYISILYISEKKIETKKIRITLKEVENLCLELKSNPLFRGHKSYIINTNYVLDFINNSSSSYVKMETNVIIPISPLKVNLLLELLNK